MTCSHCNKNIDTEGNLFPLFCPHCHEPWKKVETKTEVEIPQEEQDEKTLIQQEAEHLAYLIKEADNGNVDAMMRLGFAFSSGTQTIPINLETAAIYFNLAYENGEPDALCFLALRCHSNGENPRPESEIIALLEQSAAEGSDEGALWSGIIFTDTQEPNEFFNPEEGFRYLEQAEETISVRAAPALARCYLLGIGTEPDFHEAHTRLKYAAEYKDPYALFTLGILYQGGSMLPIDYKKSVSLLQEAHDLGYADATILLAHCYLKGTGVHQSWATGLKLFNLYSSLMDDPIPYLSPLQLIINPIMFPSGMDSARIGELCNEFPNVAYFPYLQGQAYEKEGNLEKAIESYQIAAEQDLTLALHQLATLSYEGNITSNKEQSLEDTILYHRRAADLAYGPSLLALGLLYQTGDGFTKDEKHGFKLIERAADQDYGEALFHLALSYQNECGVGRNPLKAQGLFKASLAKNYTQAKEYIKTSNNEK